MKSKLRSITVTLGESVAKWARAEAARNGINVSRLLADILKRRVQEQDGYDRAMRRALSRKPFLKSDERYLTRAEAHER